jgi:hypothetical protein
MVVEEQAVILAMELRLLELPTLVEEEVALRVEELEVLEQVVQE